MDQIRHMLRLDEDLSAFYAVAESAPELAWVPGAGAGRMLRSPTVFEDVIKTICTTNCAWSGTVRMVSALVDGARPAGRRRSRTQRRSRCRRRWPTPARTSSGRWRGPAIAGRTCARLAAAVAAGELDLEALDDPEVDDETVRERLLALDGIGPYAAAHVMMLLGRYRSLILDSWTRPTYRRLTGRHRITDKGIVRAFARYREFAGLAFWLTLTEDWVPEA